MSGVGSGVGEAKIALSKIAKKKLDRKSVAVENLESVTESIFDRSHAKAASNGSVRCCTSARTAKRMTVSVSFHSVCCQVAHNCLRAGLQAACSVPLTQVVLHQNALRNLLLLDIRRVWARRCSLEYASGETLVMGCATVGEYRRRHPDLRFHTWGSYFLTAKRWEVEICVVDAIHCFLFSTPVVTKEQRSALILMRILLIGMRNEVMNSVSIVHGRSFPVTWPMTRDPDRTTRPGLLLCEPSWQAKVTDAADQNG